MANQLYFNHAAMSLMQDATVAAIGDAAVKTAQWGTTGKIVYGEWIDEAKAQIARMVDCETDEVAITPSCSFGLSSVASGLDLKPVDSIVTWEHEYPSNAYPWIDLSRRTGAKLVRVAPDELLRLPMVHFLESITKRTRLVAYSWVQSSTGDVTPIRDVSQRCKEVGALSVVDIAQGLGILPISFRQSGADAMSGISHKWLGGPLGLGFLVMKKELMGKLRPLNQGAWNYGTSDEATEANKEPVLSMRRFETSTPPLALIRGLASAINIVQETSIDHRQKRCSELRSILVRELSEMGVRILGNPQSFDHGSIVTFEHPTKTELIASRLRERGFQTSSRLGRLRISPNVSHQEDSVFSLLREIQSVT